MKRQEEKRYEKLSPFELKDKLIKLSKAHHERLMLNAGRGNPNWVAVTPREGFFLFGRFALQESLRVTDLPAIGGFCERQGSGERFKSFLKNNKEAEGTVFLQKAFDYVKDEMNIDPDDFICELTDAVLGNNYPVPDRMLINCENIVHRYLDKEMCQSSPPPGRFDLFATEGGTAAMDYIFTSLMENKLLHKGDKVALGTPIFTPYIEIPKLNDYRFIELEIKQDENAGWQYPDSEIEKLADPKVKAFCLVNPSNPTSVSMQPATLGKIGSLVHKKRQDLIIITDDVYGTFVNGFKSIVTVAPQNTILVYSFSKYFGATGWRLGVIGIHQNNAFDRMIAALPLKDRKQLHERYSTVALNPDKMKLIDRMVADSRSVALHHTAGLSTPQQVQMVLFSLFCLTDRENKYKQAAQYIVRHRIKTLYDALGSGYAQSPYDTHYYTTIDIPKLAQERYGEKFASYLVKNFEPIDFVVKLAEKKSIVLMDGGGFDAPNMSVRVSLANLPNSTYDAIGKGISDLLEEYHNGWKSRV
ncbi:MAG: bifunctional aspartate transaminase/aspartate 4-decarboxylase [Candidatus Omnitrophota bacterium]|nr:MAG: bifunctional aspartate transaminase/aspartate 4-decarboxylase [Candidatus Omnitrophota bacterium]